MTPQGVYLQDVLEKSSLEKIVLEAGKLMVMSVGWFNYYFETAEDYEFSKEGLNEVIKATPGTVVDDKGNILAGKDYMVPSYVRFPVDSEVIWYMNLKTV